MFHPQVRAGLGILSRCRRFLTRLTNSNFSFRAAPGYNLICGLGTPSALAAVMMICLFAFVSIRTGILQASRVFKVEPEFQG